MLKAFLSGTRVLDMSQYLPGPFATRLLADMGADVVKVEPPAGDPLKHLNPQGQPGTSPFYAMINAGKTVLTLDLKTAADAEAFADLVAGADVLLESFRPGVLERLGFSNDRLEAVNPGLIHCALSGYGQTGPDRLTSGHDISYVSLSGGLAVSGTAETPTITYPPIGDHAGATQAAITILGALVARGRTGKGAYLDIGIADAMLSWQGPGLTMPPDRAAGVINGGAACYNLYRAADNRFVSLSPLEPKFWANFCTAVGRPDWVERQGDPLPQTDLIGEVAALFASQPRDHWNALLLSADCCYQAVLDYREVPDHPQVQARALVHQADGFIDVLFPAYVDGEAPRPRTPVAETTADVVLAAWQDGRTAHDAAGSEPVGAIAR